jgi:hypothetical protein
VNLAPSPCIAELIGRHRHRRKSGGGLRLHESESLAELRGNEVAQADIVDQHQQPDVARCLLRGDTDRNVAGDDRDLGFEVDAPRLVGQHDVVASALQAVRAALIHQRIGPEFRWHCRSTGTAYQLDVVHIRRAIQPLVSAWQWRHRFCRIERGGIRQSSGIELDRQRHKRRCDAIPIVESGLQRARDFRHGNAVMEIA